CEPFAESRRGWPNNQIPTSHVSCLGWLSNFSMPKKIVITHAQSAVVVFRENFGSWRARLRVRCTDSAHAGLSTLLDQGSRRRFLKISTLRKPDKRNGGSHEISRCF